jgi:hypothetical protein
MIVFTNKNIHLSYMQNAHALLHIEYNNPVAMTWELMRIRSHMLRVIDCRVMNTLYRHGNNESQYNYIGSKS